MTSKRAERTGEGMTPAGATKLRVVVAGTLPAAGLDLLRDRFTVEAHRERPDDRPEGAGAEVRHFVEIGRSAGGLQFCRASVHQRTLTREKALPTTDHNSPGAGSRKRQTRRKSAAHNRG